MMRIIFICKGNMNRSPIAERILKKELARRNCKSVDVDSYGLQGFILPPPKGKCLMDYPLEYSLSKPHLDLKGIDMSNHIAKALNELVLKEANLILTMHPDIHKILLNACPSVAGKTFLLTDVCSRNVILRDVSGSTDSNLYERTINDVEQCIITGFDKILALATKTLISL